MQFIRAMTVEPPTLICLGFEGYLGRRQPECSVDVAYRQSGASEWKEHAAASG